MLMLKIGRLFNFFGFIRPKPIETPLLPQAWVWTEYQASLPQSDIEYADLNALPMPMAWVWSRYCCELPQTEREKYLANMPKPTAWLWTEYRASLPQSEAERAELNAPPAPMTWVWSQYRRELSQTEEEKLQAEMLARLNDVVIVLRKPAYAFPTQLAASMVAGFTGLVLLFQAVVSGM